VSSSAHGFVVVKSLPPAPAGKRRVEARHRPGQDGPVTDHDAPAGPERHETEAERHDRNFDELLQELRVAQTGVQILFAFLLGAAFTRPLQQAGAFEHRLLAVTLVICALATACLIAPVAMHRWLFARHVKGRLVRASATAARAGLVMLVLGISASCLLALDAVLARGSAVVISAFVLAVLVGLWVVVPLALRRR
jgi:hypothetical protein